MVNKSPESKSSEEKDTANDKVNEALEKDDIHEVLLKLFHDKEFKTSKEIK